VRAPASCKKVEPELEQVELGFVASPAPPPCKQNRYSIFSHVTVWSHSIFKCLIGLQQSHSIFKCLIGLQQKSPKKPELSHAKKAIRLARRGLGSGCYRIPNLRSRSAGPLARARLIPALPLGLRASGKAGPKTRGSLARSALTH
jgi:hypothetical protein